MDRLRLFTWHVHGSYLRSLAQVPHDVYVPTRPGRPDGYGGRAGPGPWPDNLHEVPVEEVPGLDLDAVVYQGPQTWSVDGPEVLSAAQRRLPAVYLEHDPPRASPTDTPVVVDDPDVLVVHVTAFNRLMWDNGTNPTCVIEHGVPTPEHVAWTGERDRGLTVVNNLGSRGRRLGADVFAEVAAEVPIDLVGMGSAELGGLGEVPHHELAAFSAPYRFFFNPIRYTSLGLAVCEAMMLGMPVVALATTEVVTVVVNGESGWVDTDPRVLVSVMRRLLDHPDEARELGEGARRTALRRFALDRFVVDWDRTLRTLVADGPAAAAATAHERVASVPAAAHEPLPRSA